MPSFFKTLVGLDAQLHLAAAADQDHLRVAVFGVGHDIGAAREARGRRVAVAVEHRQRLAAEHQAGRLDLSGRA